MPLLRSGDLLFNAFVLQSRIVDGTGISQAVNDLRGTPDRTVNVFSNDAYLIGPRVFGDGDELRDILFRHTPFGVYSRGMSEEVVEDCIQAQRDGRRGDLNYRLAIGTPRADLLVTTSLRSCEKCVADDVESQGFAAWRVLHQMTGIDRCPHHGEALRTELANPRPHKPRLWAFRLPGESRDGLPQPKAIPLSEGYATYLELWPRLLSGELDVVRPKSWYVFISSLIADLGGVEQAREFIEGSLERSWEMRLGKIAAALFLTGNESCVAQELSFHTRPSDIARRLLIYAAAKQSGLIVEREGQIALRYDPDPPGENLSQRAMARQRVYERVWAEVMAAGYPVGLTHALFEDAGPAEVARMSGLERGQVRSFVFSLADDLLIELATLREWTERSWLRREITRRNIRLS